jgi:hypothetical protein
LFGQEKRLGKVTSLLRISGLNAYGTMIDASRVPRFRQVLIRELGHAGPQVFDLLRAGGAIVELTNLRAESVGTNASRCEKEVDVKITVVAFRAGRVHGRHHRGAVSIDELVRQRAHEVSTLVRRQLIR